MRCQKPNRTDPAQHSRADPLQRRRCRQVELLRGPALLCEAPDLAAPAAHGTVSSANTNNAVKITKSATGPVKVLQGITGTIELFKSGEHSTWHGRAVSTASSDGSVLLYRVWQYLRGAPRLSPPRSRAPPSESRRSGRRPTAPRSRSTPRGAGGRPPSRPAPWRRSQPRCRAATVDTARRIAASRSSANRKVERRREQVS